MRLNGLGVALYVLMTGWLLLSSVGRLMIELSADAVDWLPFVGLALGLLALAGLGAGRVLDERDSDVSQGHEDSARRRATLR